MRVNLIILLFVCLFLGCSSSPIADDLAQREANEIVAVLVQHGIESEIEKQKGGKGRYSVSVSQSNFGKAIALLHALGLPAERKTTFSELVAPSGLLPSSREVEALRLDRAVAAEIEDLLKGHPAIASASVVARVNGAISGDRNSEQSAGSKSSSVSAVVQVKPGVRYDLGELQRVIAQTLPGIKTEDVVLAINDQRTPESLAASSQAGSTTLGTTTELVPFLLYWTVPADQYAGMATSVGLLVMLMGVLAGVAGYILGQYFLSRHSDFPGPQNFDTLGPQIGVSARVRQIGGAAKDNDLGGEDESTDPGASAGSGGPFQRGDQ